MRARSWLAVLVLLAPACGRPLPVVALPAVRPAAPLPRSPQQLYGQLFVAVQTARIYRDQKSFVDATPMEEPATILRQFETQRIEPGFSLAAFVQAHFAPPTEPVLTALPQQPLRRHIDSLWPLLTRTTTSAPANSSLLPLPKPYVVPGGRFREGYYWDTYFAMLGLQAAGRQDLLDAMLDNFAYEVETFGHIPNGNRTYYLSRSQPPFFSFMVTLVAEQEGDAVLRKYLPYLRKEYAYWMQGAAGTRPGEATRHVVMLDEHTVLNRYWDELDIPRDESYLDDLRTAHESGRPANEVYRDLRAAAESGWDFSSRWLENGELATIRTTSIVPVDLNSLLFYLEETIARGCRLTRDAPCVAEFVERARQRAAAINEYLWNEHGYYGDYDWRLHRRRDDRSAAMLYPLFVGAATPARARRTAEEAAATLLEMGGLVTTLVHSGQQWDAPNAWAPLQWIAVKGLQRYGLDELARQIGARFLRGVVAVYESTHELVEKYRAEGPGAFSAGGGGEYPTQDGFGWTNGVTVRFLDAFPSREHDGDRSPSSAAGATRCMPLCDRRR